MADNDMMVPAQSYTADSFMDDDLLEAWIRPLIAEAIGTFALVFAGCGAIMVDAKTGDLGHAGVAIAFGLEIMVMI